MKIAIPVKSNNEIDAHFGHCEFYQIYTVSDDKKIVSTERMESPKGCGCKSNIASVFEQDGVNVMLAGGIGDGAVNVLKQHGISVVRNCQGNVDTLISQYLTGYIVDGGQNCHAHENEHECSHD